LIAVDGLVGLTAELEGLTLVTADVRALAEYELVGARTELLSA
jgi:hypothetical protein